MTLETIKNKWVQRGFIFEEPFNFNEQKDGNMNEQGAIHLLPFNGDLPEEMINDLIGVWLIR
jgi:hypothetical protein